jgi:hypothetical protein
MMYNEIFQALMVEGDVLISKPLLDLAFDTVKRCKSPTSKKFLQIPNMWKLKQAKPGMYGGWESVAMPSVQQCGGGGVSSI